MVARTGEKAGRLRARAFRTVDDLDRLADEVATTAERHDMDASEVLSRPMSNRAGARHRRRRCLPARPLGRPRRSGPWSSPPADVAPAPSDPADALDAAWPPSRRHR